MVTWQGLYPAQALVAAVRTESGLCITLCYRLQKTTTSSYFPIQTLLSFNHKIRLRHLLEKEPSKVLKVSCQIISNDGLVDTTITNPSAP